MLSSRVQDLTGKRFGAWTVLSYGGRSQRGNCVLWNCRCDCGAAAVLYGGSLRCGHTHRCSACNATRISEALKGNRNAKGCRHTNRKRFGVIVD